jgi:cytosolic carboxypeptidase protein 2/3
MYIDLHGHSRKMNVFMYGCEEKKAKPKPAVRVFPRLLSWNRHVAPPSLRAVCVL